MNTHNMTAATLWLGVTLFVSGAAATKKNLNCGNSISKTSWGGDVACTQKIATTSAAIQLSNIRVKDVKRSYYWNRRWRNDRDPTSYASYVFNYCGRSYAWAKCESVNNCHCLKNYDLGANCERCTSRCDAGFALIPACSTQSDFTVTVSPGIHHWYTNDNYQYTKFNFEIEYDTQAQVTCDGYTSCPSGTSLKAAAAQTVCATATCTSSECCDALPQCSSFTCPSGQQPKAASTVCSSAGCDAAQCCDDTSSCARPLTEWESCNELDQRHCCSTGLICNVQHGWAQCIFNTPSPSIAGCASPLSQWEDCSGPDKRWCCDVGLRCDVHQWYAHCIAGEPEVPTMCTDYTCPSGQGHKVDANTVRCGATVSDCSAALCCTPLVFCNSGPACPTNTALKSASASIICGVTVAGCVPSTCCNALCSGHTCPSGEALKSAANTIDCGSSTCTNTQCCETHVTCSGFSCPSNTSPKNNLAGIDCMATSCTNAQCCD
eukprot:Rhum_TRINITY_DN20806_c0_g1::Rhum_TRINITY_DN20806_c0_g1_i1::g.172268::m.172268